MNSKSLTSFTSLCLKVLSGILIFSSLVDYLLAAFPFQPLQSDWQVNFTGQVVGRGFNPMLGIIFLVLACWLDQTLNSKATIRAKVNDTRFLSFILSFALGLLFFLLIPLHISNMQQARDAAMTRIDAQARQDNAQVQSQYNDLEALSKNPEAQKQLDEQLKKIDAAIASGQVPGQQLAEVQARREELANYQKFAKSPESLNARLKELQDQVIKTTNTRKQEAQSKVSEELLQTSIRSFLLAIGYVIIGWLGIQTSLSSGSGDRPNLANTDEDTLI